MNVLKQNVDFSRCVWMGGFGDGESKELVIYRQQCKPLTEVLASWIKFEIATIPKSPSVSATNLCTKTWFMVPFWEGHP
jgi:hypothetical protein